MYIESDMEKMRELLDVLKDLGLELNWIIAVAALSAQEIAIKRKLDELGEPYGERDFQKLANNLTNAMKNKGGAPSILLSISRSYRHIRAELIHTPHKSKVSPQTAESILYNTKALVEELFKDIKISKFVESIGINYLESVKEFSSLDKITKKKIFNAIMDKIVIFDWDDAEDYEYLFEFLKDTLKEEKNSALKGELFEKIVHGTASSFNAGKSKLIPLINEFTRQSNIKEFIKEKEELKKLILAEYKASWSFTIAALNAKTVLNIRDTLNDDEIVEVLEAFLRNGQIRDSYGAMDSIREFLTYYKDRVPEEKVNEVEEALNE